MAVKTLQEQIKQCLGCTLSGHWPTVGDEADAFVASRDDEQLERWRNYINGITQVACCGRAREES